MKYNKIFFTLGSGVLLFCTSFIAFLLTSVQFLVITPYDSIPVEKRPVGTWTRSVSDFFEGTGGDVLFGAILLVSFGVFVSTLFHGKQFPLYKLLVHFSALSAFFAFAIFINTIVMAFVVYPLSDLVFGDSILPRFSVYGALSWMVIMGVTWYLQYSLFFLKNKKV